MAAMQDMQARCEPLNCATSYIYIHITVLKGETASFELAASRSGLDMFLKEWQITVLSYPDSSPVNFRQIDSLRGLVIDKILLL